MPQLESPPYRLAGAPAFEHLSLERAAEVRHDPGRIEALRSDPRATGLVVRQGRALVHRDGLQRVPSSELTDDNSYLLGMDDEGPVFVLHADQPLPESTSASLRSVAARLTDRDLGLLMSAVALTNWHERHPRCSRCGTRTDVTEAGWARHCRQDGSDHYPRTDPAVIVLVLDGAPPGADRALLGRHASWPEGRFSTLAGFVEPGETVEQAVAREIIEEVGVPIASLSYAGSQPWPFPSSLMLAFYAVAEPGHVDDAQLRVDGDEIAEARWFDRGTVAERLASGRLLVPPRLSVARRLIEGWFGGPIDTSGTWRP